jgi:thiol:disulfide interchange protein DsbC
MKFAKFCGFFFLSIASIWADAEIEAVRQSFGQRFPNEKAQAVERTPIQGLFQVITQRKDIVYTDKQARYFLDGNLLDTVKKVNLTEARLSELNKIDWKLLPLDQAIKEVRGNGSRRLAVFSDPDCPFCKRLERDTLAKMDDITTYTFLLPLPELHKDAPRKSRQIWCSSNRTSAWLGFMRDGKSLSGSDRCTHPLANIQKLGQQFGIRGTPHIILPDGRSISGAVPKERLEQELTSGRTSS